MRNTGRELEPRMPRPAEEARAASLYARSLIEASLDPLVTISPEGKITFIQAQKHTSDAKPVKRLFMCPLSHHGCLNGKLSRKLMFGA